MNRMSLLFTLVFVMAAGLATSCKHRVNAFDSQVEPSEQAAEVVEEATSDTGPAAVDAGPVNQDEGPVNQDADPVTQDTGPVIQDAGAVVQDADAGSPIFGCTDPDALNYNPAATVDDGSCLANVTVTFNLDTSCASSVVAPQVAGGNTFGIPGDYPMSDPDGDEVWTTAIELTPNLNTDYTYTTDACGDFTCKENIGGQDCAVEPYSDRSFNTGTEDSVLNACFGNCGDGFCGQCPPDSPPPGGASSCEAPLVKVDFFLDMAAVWDLAKANVIAVHGSFNADGSWTGVVMERIPVTKLFMVAICLEPGADYAFKFAAYQFANGVEEFPPNAYSVGQPPCPEVTATTDCPYGACTDRLVHTGQQDMALGVFPWEGCESQPYDE